MILIKVLKKEVRFYLYLNSAQETQDHNTIEKLHQEFHQFIKEKEREKTCRRERMRMRV